MAIENMRYLEVTLGDLGNDDSPSETAVFSRGVDDSTGWRSVYHAEQPQDRHNVQKQRSHDWSNGRTSRRLKGLARSEGAFRAASPESCKVNVLRGA